MSLYHFVTYLTNIFWHLFWRFVYDKPKVKFTHSSNHHTEHNIKQLYYPTRTKHDCISALCIYNCSTSVAGHTKDTVGFRGSIRSTRGLGPTMTARGQSIGILIGILPQTLIMSITVQKTSKYYTTEFDHEEEF